MVGEVPKNITQRMPTAVELGRIQLSGENVALQAILRRTAPEALYYWGIIEDVIALSKDATP